MTTTLQDAYAPSIRRREEIVAREYTTHSSPEPVVSDDGRFLSTLWDTTKQIAPGGVIAIGVTVFVMDAISSEITLNGEPMAFDVRVVAAFLVVMMAVATVLTAGLRYKVETEVSR